MKKDILSTKAESTARADAKPLQVVSSPPPARPRPRPADRFDDALEFADLGEDFDPPPRTDFLPPDATPNPVELPAPINPEGGRKQSVEMHRNLFCVHYDACLDEAVKRAWNSFTCVRCAFYHTGSEEEDGVQRFATQRR